MWETVIATALIMAFGYASVLHVIFYAGAVLGETIMEIWEPVFYDSQPAEVFKIRQAPENSPLPTRRSEAKVLTHRSLKFLSHS